jgi:hypothetical protein
MNYTVVQDAQHSRGVKLFLLDHHKRGFWWGYKLDENVKWFISSEEAEVVCHRLRYNNPRVVSEYEARLIADRNYGYYRELEMSQAHLEGWDDHKDSF